MSLAEGQIFKHWETLGTEATVAKLLLCGMDAVAKIIFSLVTAPRWRRGEQSEEKRSRLSSGFSGFPGFPSKAMVPSAKQQDGHDNGEEGRAEARPLYVDVGPTLSVTGGGCPKLF